MRDQKESVFYQGEWRWSNFLKYLVSKLNKYDLIENVLPSKFAFKESTYGPKKSKNNVQLLNWSAHNKKINLARAVCINSPTYEVLNFLIIPNTIYNVPFFGVDFVTLPNLHLLVLDFQPSLPIEKQFDKDLLGTIIKMKNTYHQVVPYGGKMPSEVDKFFSPGLIWSKLPKNSKSNDLIANQIYSAFQEYLNLYLEILFASNKIQIELESKIKQGQNSYLNYRKAKDPARPMLTNLFGKEFTEELIENILFSAKQPYN
ncbi:MAG: phycoerythrobilin:ferredoxin oxidoreductase [Prochlorococcus sp. SP3034]|nr:phycoerythrobilin:ferredoxin oxidoreductase [Prochlorococcus sp. SP3034]|tara:strand:- start:801 stop:1577 length:777 start_codon:yes stop_codon:yes gene_type:complete